MRSPSLRLSPRSNLAGRERGKVRVLDDNGANSRPKDDAASSRSVSVKPPALPEDSRSLTAPEVHGFEVTGVEEGEAILHLLREAEERAGVRRR